MFLSRFEDLAIKTLLVATNYLDRNEMAFDAGRLISAVAGPMAVPASFLSSLISDKVFIDGGP